MTDPTPVVLSVRDLHVSFPSEAGRVTAVRGMSFDVPRGRTLGIVGESGSGKSVTSLAIMGLLPQSAAVSGSVSLAGRELLTLDDVRMSAIRGREIAMIFQDPLSSLTPAFTIGQQLVEAIRVHQTVSKRAAWNRAVDLLDMVGIPQPATRARAFPHEFSGGMRQRVMIAMAIANDPVVIIADEPTSALDVTIQAQVLEVLSTARREMGASLVLITHDLGVVAGHADDVIVMYAGRAVEQTSVERTFGAPRMPYTLGLLQALPRIDRGDRAPLVPIEGNPPALIDLPAGCPFLPRCPIAVDECARTEPELVAVPDPGTIHRAACHRAAEIDGGHIDDRPVFPVPALPQKRLGSVPREERPIVLEVDDLHRTFPLFKGALLKRRVGTVHAVNGVSFDLREGETLAIVGESGCGKTTTLLEIMNLRPERGTLRVGQVDVAGLSNAAEIRALRRDLQIVFQDPAGALDPRLTVFEIIGEPLRALGATPDEIEPRVEELMALVGLDPTQADRFPRAFSGGQRQRIGIARALSTNPKLVVLDEPVSALDVSIRAGVINLLDELKATLHLSYLLVGHDLAVVRHLADRVAVMHLGAFVEYGDADRIFDSPRHPYTEALLSAVPRPDPAIERTRHRIILSGDPPGAGELAGGCTFRSRCPLFASLAADDQRKCIDDAPLLSGADDAHTSACHYR